MKSSQVESSTVQKNEGTKKETFVEPRLTFVKPKLEKHGKVEELTGFFGTFSP